MDDNMEFEMQNLSRDLNTAKNKVVSLEREVDLGELERFKLDEKLQKSFRKCEDLEETVTRLLEEQKKSDDREKRAVNRCNNISAENLRISSEFHNSISEFNKMIKQLKSKNVENERLAGLLQEKYDRFDAIVTKMGKEIEDLRREKLEALERAEELSLENAENKKTIEDLKLKCSESDKVADVYKNRFENLSPRMNKIEENLAEMMTMKVGDLANFVNNLRELDFNSKGFPGSKGKDDDTSGNAAKSNKVARDIIEIIDSDDEANHDGAVDVSNVGENEMKFVQSPSSQRSKRSREEDLFANSTNERKRNTHKC